jgi:hypothetical protein
MPHGVKVPTHAIGGVPFQVQPSPCLAWHRAWVSCAEHGSGVPLQLEDAIHEQPFSPLQAVDVVFALQGMTTPTHVPAAESEHPWQ